MGQFEIGARWSPGSGVLYWCRIHLGLEVGTPRQREGHCAAIYVALRPSEQIGH